MTKETISTFLPIVTYWNPREIGEIQSGKPVNKTENQHFFCYSQFDTT